jgi:hypothetical protein
MRGAAGQAAGQAAGGAMAGPVGAAVGGQLGGKLANRGTGQDGSDGSGKSGENNGVLGALGGAAAGCWLSKGSQNGQAGIPGGESSGRDGITGDGPDSRNGMTGRDGAGLLGAGGQDNAERDGLPGGESSSRGGIAGRDGAGLLGGASSERAGLPAGQHDGHALGGQAADGPDRGLPAADRPGEPDETGQASSTARNPYFTPGADPETGALRGERIRNMRTEDGDDVPLLMQGADESPPTVVGRDQGPSGDDDPYLFDVNTESYRRQSEIDAEDRAHGEERQQQGESPDHPEAQS